MVGTALVCSAYTAAPTEEWNPPETYLEKFRGHLPEWNEAGFDDMPTFIVDGPSNCSWFRGRSRYYPLCSDESKARIRKEFEAQKAKR